MNDEGALDPRVVEFFEANPITATPLEELTPEILELARGPFGAPPTRDIARITDDEVEGIRVRFYEHDEPATGLVVYFHGGGFCIGSIGLMDNVARELAHASGAAVVSVEYRLAPENPYPAGLDDCETVTRWAVANASRFGVDPRRVVVGGESAGGNLAAAVSLRLRGDRDVALAGQLLMYPGIDGGSWEQASKREFAGIVLTRKGMEAYWSAYSAGRDLSGDPCAMPLRADSLGGLPPALVVLGGCDLLRDEGREYARRMKREGVQVEEECFAGQPHGFLNFGVPAAADAFAHIGEWLQKVLAPA